MAQRTSKVAGMDQKLKDECIRLALEGKNIEAIKLIRDTFGCSLKEAKDAFEEGVLQYFGTAH